MNKYTVAITEIVEYLVPVDATSPQAAEEIGMQMLIDHADRDKWCVAVTERDVEGVNKG